MQANGAIRDTACIRFVAVEVEADRVIALRGEEHARCHIEMLVHVTRQSMAEDNSLVRDHIVVGLVNPSVNLVAVAERN